jgi:hypothetical protein
MEVFRGEGKWFPLMLKKLFTKMSFMIDVIKRKSGRGGKLVE